MKIAENQLDEIDWMRSINELSMKLRSNVEWNQLEPIDSDDLTALNGRN